PRFSTPPGEYSEPIQWLISRRPASLGTAGLARGALVVHPNEVQSVWRNRWARAPGSGVVQILPRSFLGQPPRGHSQQPPRDHADHVPQEMVRADGQPDARSAPDTLGGRHVADRGARQAPRALIGGEVVPAEESRERSLHRLLVERIGDVV